MALTETRPETDRDVAVALEPAGPTEIQRLVGSGDHLTLGRIYSGFALVFLAISAVGLALAGLDMTSAEGLLGGISDRLWPSSLAALVLLGVLPLFIGLAVSVVPLQLGSPSISFPRAVGLSMWGWLVGAVLFVVSIVIEGGIGGTDDDAARLGNVSLGLIMASLALGAVCVATTVFAHRPVGMILARVPFFSWSMLVAAPVWVLTLGATIAQVVVGQITHADAAALSENFDANIAWFLRAPAVYMVAIPALGIAADVVGRFSGRRLAPYGVIQGAIAVFAVFSFGVWVQGAPATETIVWAGFVVLAGLPVLALLGGLADALRRGRFSGAAALGGSLLAVLLVLGAVLSAALQALDSAGSGNLFDLQTPHLGYAQALFAIAAGAVGAVAGLFNWSERLFGSPAAEGPARASVAAVVLGGALTATVLLVQAIAAGDGRDGLAEGLVFGAVAAGALLMALGVLLALAGAVGSARDAYEGSAGGGVARGGTLEWDGTGVAVAGRGTVLPTIGSPYPLSDRDGTDSDEESN